MAEETPKIPAEPRTESGLKAAPAEADQLFRLQVALGDFFVNNARYLGGIVGLVLLGTLAWGLWNHWAGSRAREDFGAIADIDFRMPKVDEMARFGLVPMDDPADAERMGNLEEGARRFEAAAAAARGTAAVYGWLKAAEAWERRGNRDAQRAALERAYALGAADLPGFTAASAYANVLVDAERYEEAIGVLREAAGRFEGILAEELLILLAQAQTAAGKDADARAVVDEFRTRFPDSPRVARVEAAVKSMGVPQGAGG